MRKYLFVCALVLVGCKDQKKPAPAPRAPVAVKPNPVSPRTSGEAIEYTVRFPDAKNHYAEVEAVFPAGADETVLAMAVWSPGSYLVREYARNVDAVTASTLSGEPLKIEKIRKNRWRVATSGRKRFVARYRLYCSELAVQDNFVNADMAVLNGASTFITLADGKSSPHDVRFEKPAGWQKLVTAMPAHPDGAPEHFLAPNFDILVDSPVIAGDVTVYPFAIEGVPHELANLGEGGIWDGPRSARDVEKLAQAMTATWRVIPYPRYVFQNVLAEGRGGLEHLGSTLMMSSRFNTKKRKAYVGWLGLVSHEFFHAWNVKRMRPITLGPFDYENEVYTSSLWIAEGFTSYYDDLTLSRAGLITEEEFLENLSKQIETVETTPGRLVQPLADSSFDSWIKLYRPSENSKNTTINYYPKGAIVALLLDTEIRNATGGKRSLDDVMRLCYQRYSGESGYTPLQFEQVAAEVAGKSLDWFFRDYVDGIKPLDYQPFLKRYGVRFVTSEEEKEDDADAVEEQDEEKKERDKEPPGWIGVEVEGSMITYVERDTPGHAAGLNPKDEILAIDNHRVAAGKLDERLEFYRPGDKISLLVARRSQLKTLEVTLGKKPEPRWSLEVDPNAAGTTRQNRALWLGPAALSAKTQ